MKKVLILLFASLAIAACNREKVVDVETVTLSENVLTLYRGDQQTLVVTVSPASATDQIVQWNSSNPKVATVEGGKVTALEPGTAVISAVVAGKSAACALTVEPDLYVIGCERLMGDSGPTYAMVWKNGVGSRLTDGKNYATGTCVHIEGDDLYVGGMEMSGFKNDPVYARIWKNEELIFEENEYSSIISAIDIHDGVLYAAGDLSGSGGLDEPVLWKDGVRETLNYDGYDGGQTFCMKISGNDIYIGGCVMKLVVIEGRISVSMMPVIWKNGVRRDMSEYMTKLAFVLSIDLSPSGDIYACGYKAGKAMFWKNTSEEVLIADGNASHLTLSGNDVYITGWEIRDTNFSTGMVWKNKEILFSIPDGEYSSVMIASALWNQDIYTAGERYITKTISVPEIWKNGVSFKVLTDGTKDAEVHAIALR